MATDRVEALLDGVASAGCLYLTITGGDPMLRRDFPGVYRHARKKGMLVTVFCNGTLVSDTVLRAFAEYPPRLVEISVYGASAETHERVTRVPGSYAMALRGLRRLVGQGARVGLKSLLMTVNRHELGDMQRLAAAHGVKFRFDGALFPRLADLGGQARSLRVGPEQVVAAEMAQPERRAQWARSFDRAQRRPAGRPDAPETGGGGFPSRRADVR